MTICKTCNGKGIIDDGYYDGHRWEKDIKVCPSCTIKPTVTHQHNIQESGKNLICKTCNKKWILMES